jgi:hypothetical protein
MICKRHLKCHVSTTRSSTCSLKLRTFHRAFDSSVTSSEVFQRTSHRKEDRDESVPSYPRPSPITLHDPNARGKAVGKKFNHTSSAELYMSAKLL